MIFLTVMGFWGLCGKSPSGSDTGIVFTGIAEILSLAHRNQGNWPMTLKESPLQTDFYV
ncbi:hypothetical protein QUF80_06345 [Desulfococcaceae bacterium HSG8]|nr:hypothetical protein [Desulfococcaceae bacterium HSG8]